MSIGSLTRPARSWRENRVPLQILHASDPDARHEWLDAWERLGREPFAHPGFMELLADRDGKSVLLLDIEKDTGLPLVIRTVGQRPGALPTRDAISPYGYGGPFGGNKESRASLLREAVDWARNERLASVFLRLSLGVVTQQQSADYTVLESGPNVRVDLRRSFDQVWMAFDPKVRKNAKKAERNGCQVEVLPGRGRPREFVQVYHSTLSRREARAQYWYGDEFFDGLEETGVEVEYYIVRDKDARIVSVEAVLISDENYYSFLGGTLADAFALAPNDLLKCEIVRRAIARQRKYFVLGGGPTGSVDDGVFRYKRSFARTGVTPFLTLRSITSREEFARLVASRMEDVDWETECSRPGFPRYRFPIQGD